MTHRETANSALSSLHQMMPLQQPGPAMMGYTSSNQLDVLPLQLLSNHVGNGVTTENGFIQRHPSTYQGQQLLMKNLTDAQGGRMFLNSIGQQQCLNCYEPAPQQPTILSPGNLMSAGIGIPGCPSSYPCLQQSSTNVGTLDAFDQERAFVQGSFGLDEKQSSNDKSSGSSTKSAYCRPRWRPNDHQLEILERYSESGGTRATAELHAAIQGCGQATENNVAVWLKNRSSRRKKTCEKFERDHCLQDVESDVDLPLNDFAVASRAVMNELTGVISGVRRSDALYLASAIQEAQHICCYGVGKGALVMKGFGSGLHHLGYDAFFVDDTNIPHFDNKSLALISAGPGSGNRVFGMIDDMRSAGSHIIVFATYRMEDTNRPFIHTILIPSHSQSPLHVGSDGEVMSAMPDPPQDALLPGTLFDLSLTLLCECVCVMLRRAGDITPAEIRARHTNLE